MILLFIRHHKKEKLPVFLCSGWVRVGDCTQLNCTWSLCNRGCCKRARRLKTLRHSLAHSAEFSPSTSHLFSHSSVVLPHPDFLHLLRNGAFEPSSWRPDWRNQPLERPPPQAALTLWMWACSGGRAKGALTKKNN